MQNSIDVDAQAIREQCLDVKQELFNFVKFVGLTCALNSCRIFGACGYAAHLIFLVIFVAPFTNKNIYRAVIKNPKRLVSKDAIYNFLKSKPSNWRALLYRIGLKLVIYLSVLTSKKHKKVFIIDDTPLKKNSSRFVELLSKCYDHVEHKFFKGFRLLNISWFDGYSLIPVFFSLLASRDIKNRYNETSKNFDKRSNSFKRREEAISGAKNAVLKFVDYAASKFRGYFDAIVFDSWFAFSELIYKISKVTTVVCMIKKNAQLKFRVNNRTFLTEGIYRILAKKCGKAKVVGSMICDMIYKHNNIEKTIKVKIVFLRHRKTGDWIPILSTNIKWTDAEIIEVYGMRWGIEVFHRDVKQFFNIQTGCQSTDFDSLYAYITIAYIQYSFISYKKRKNNDKRTIGELFYCVYDEVKSISFEEAYENALKDAVERIKSMSFIGKNKNGNDVLCIEVDVVKNILSSVSNHALSIENSIRSMLDGLVGCINIESELADRLRSDAA